MNVTDSYKSFLDKKLYGVEKLNESCNNNVTACNKFIRILKEYHLSHDSYSKAIVKSNTSLCQLTKNKGDSFHPIFDSFSTTFSVLVNVQKDFSKSLSHIIKTLTLVFEHNVHDFWRIFDSQDMNLVNDFKNSQLQMEKWRQKYMTSRNDKNEKVTKRSRDKYEASIDKYNKLREKFIDIMEQGFVRSKNIQLGHIETMQKCMKNIIKAFSKLTSDINESVDSMNNFHCSTSKEDLFKLWVESNKTVDDFSDELFVKVVLESGECEAKEDKLIEIRSGTESCNTVVTNSCKIKRQKKLTQPRLSAPNIDVSESNVSEDTATDPLCNEISSSNKKMFEKSNSTALKNSKRKWAGFGILKKFKSASDLVNVSEENELDTDWQSKSNIHEKVIVDDEGFIVRSNKTDSIEKFSESSSSNSLDEGKPKETKQKKFQVHLRSSNIAVIGPNVIEKLNAEPLCIESPIYNKNKFQKINAVPFKESRRRSSGYGVLKKFQSASDLVNVSEETEWGKDFWLSNSNLKDKGTFDNEGFISGDNKTNSMERYSESSSSNSFDGNKPKEIEVISLPTVVQISSAIAEIISSNEDGSHCVIQGKLELSWPIRIKDFFDLTTNLMPELIEFRLISDIYDFSTVQLLKQYHDVARLETISSKHYNISLLKDLLRHISMDNSLHIKGSRIYFALLEYSVNVNEEAKTILDCREKWDHVDKEYIQFDFTLFSRFADKYKYVIVRVRLLSEGTIYDIFASTETSSEKHNERYWSIHFGKLDGTASVKIKNNYSTVVKVKLSYEFILENCSLTMPDLQLRSQNESSITFELSSMHYTTVAAGNLCQIFSLNLS